MGMSIEQSNNQEKNDQYYLAKLEKELAEIEETLRKNKVEGPETGDDVVENQEERDQQEQIIFNAKERQTEIERAIKWTKENGGICAVCNKPIETTRRDADPASVTCIKDRELEDTIEV